MPYIDPAFQMREMTRGCPPLEDRRGPLVYDLTETPSQNGVNPECCGEPIESEETDEGY